METAAAQANVMNVPLSIKDMLVIVDIEGDQPASQAAAELAALARAHLTGLSLVYDLASPSIGYAALPSDVIVEARRAALAKAHTAARRFERIAQYAGCGHSTHTEEKIFFGDFAEVVRQARLRDLIVVRRDDQTSREAMRIGLIETLLFEGGAPLLVIPTKPRLFALKKAIVAWDGSLRAARALRAALPLLACCSSIDVATVQIGDDEQGGHAEVISYLSRHGISATHRTVFGAEGGVAATLLDLTQRGSADLLVMGAYYHSRFREHLLGGATYDVLRDTIIPVLMTH